MGSTLQLQPLTGDGTLRYAVRVVGCLTGASLIVTAPMVNGRGQAVRGNNNCNTQILGVGVDYAAMKSAVPISGRFISDAEIRSRQKVAVLGATVIKNLFGSVNPVGQSIKISRIKNQKKLCSV